MDICKENTVYLCVFTAYSKTSTLAINCQQGSRRSADTAPVLPPEPSYFKRPKSSPVRPLACNWYYCAHFIAKPKAACALRFSWAATSSNLGL